MCEWLPNDEWCDVQLSCNGHNFSAHRAVLASVSSYLRKVLLSCPASDSPAFIILPDFDLDAVSSVLYYVYHGEVLVPRLKLYIFLDIIRTLQIYIDPEYLPKISDSAEKSLLDFNMCRESNLPTSDDTTSLDCVNNESQHYANLKKGMAIEDILCKVQCSFDSLDFRDKQIRRRSWSEKFNSSAGDLMSRCVDRQRGSFLRDLFIETYAQNGNGNGLAASVLAISNERYREPTSVLFTNANGKHPSANDNFSGISKIASSIRPYLSPKSNKSLQTYKNLYNDRLEIFPDRYIKNYTESQINIKFLTESQFKQGLWLKNEYLPLRFNNNYFFESERTTLDLRISLPHSKTVDTPYDKEAMVKSDTLIRDLKGQIIQTKASTYMDFNSKSAVAKDVILNKVLQSPWCPRLPYYNRPYRRKFDKSKQVDTLQVQLHTCSDKHNDINELIPQLTPTETTKNSNCEIRDASVTSRSLHMSARKELKCTTCNQIFTSDESYTTHMRRHSSTTRYSCGECYKTFSQLRNFKYHMSVHRGTKEFATTCPICGKYFNDKGYLSSHMKIHRNRKEYKCSMCPKSFNQRVAYNMHVRIHTGVKPHVCDECGKAFSRKMLLKQHQRTHSGERPYACPHCDKRFADRSNMTLHLRLHTGIKPFSCSLCSKSFTKKHHLKSHLNFHTGAKPYSCPSCKLTFTQSSNMRTHLKKCSVPQIILTADNS